MRTLVTTIFLLLAAVTGTQAQSLRYFEIRTNCGHGDWRDSSFIVAASDPALISRTLDELAKPYSSRKFISGQLDYGHAGYNRNAGHWFRWHIKPDAWDLVELAVEICDGCPYSDVDQDTAMWVGKLKQFCPWSGRPERELSEPASIKESHLFPSLRIWPQPASRELRVETGSNESYNLELYDATGRLLSTQAGLNSGVRLDIDVYAPGIYLLRLANARGSVQRIIQKQ